MERSNRVCKYDEHGVCTAPYTICPHWQGIYCGYDGIADKIEKYNQAVNEIKQFVAAHPEALDKVAKKYISQFVDVKDVALDDKVI